MAKIARPEQDAAINAIFNYFEVSDGNPLVQACVGFGKSYVIAKFMKKAHEIYPSTKFMVVTHLSELLTQISGELKECWPDAKKSFYSAKLNMKSLAGDIIFASIQSVYSKAYNLRHKIDLLIIDESHLVSQKDATTYKKLIADLKKINPYLKIVGFTGTPFRQGEGSIVGPGKLFTDKIFHFSILEGIEAGYLCEPITPIMRTRMSVEGVGKRNGDYIEGELQRAVDKIEITKACVDEIIEHGVDRKKWLVFTAGVEHCLHVRDEIRSRGIICEMITGKTPTAERQRIIKDYREGKIRCLVNVATLTTGFNDPEIDLMAYMRPTRSAVLYVQTMGRCIRAYPGKENALVLDFGDVIATLGPVDKIDIKYTPSGDGEAPIKVCPKCASVCYAGVRVCPDCGHVFEFNKTPINRKAGNAPVLSTQEEPIETHPVIGMEIKEHAKKGDPSAPTTMCVTYFIKGNQKFSEYVCFNHKGYAREKAEKWHEAMLPDEPAPDTVLAATKLLYPIPTAITVRPDGKYWRIIGYEWPEPVDLTPPF